MAQPFEHVTHLILATGRKLFPFLVLSVGGVRGYFASREDADTFISMEGNA